MTEIVSVLLGGLAYGVPIFLVASGLTLIYGVIGVLNFAHGALFVIGALLTTSVLGGSIPSVALFAVAVLLGGLLSAGVGAVVEMGVVRRLYRADHMTMLLGTYAVLLTLVGLSQVVWGIDNRTQRQPEAFAGDVNILGAHITIYDIVLVVIGAAVAGLLWLLINRTSVGRAVRAIAQDSTMAQAVGINSRGVLLAVFAAGSLLAGLAGGLTAPTVSVSPALADVFILQCFAVVIVGGLGSVTGSLIASVLVGISETAAVTWAPVLTGFTFYILVAAVLVLRPQGLLGNTRLRRS